MAFLGLWLGLGETSQIRGGFGFLAPSAWFDWKQENIIIIIIISPVIFALKKKDKGDLNNFMLSLGLQSKKSLS